MMNQHFKNDVNAANRHQCWVDSADGRKGVGEKRGKEESRCWTNRVRKSEKTNFQGIEPRGTSSFRGISPLDHVDLCNISIFEMMTPHCPFYHATPVFRCRSNRLLEKFKTASQSLSQESASSTFVLWIHFVSQCTASFATFCESLAMIPHQRELKTIIDSVVHRAVYSNMRKRGTFVVEFLYLSLIRHDFDLEIWLKYQNL